MSEAISLTDLLNPENFDKYKDKLASYFGKGGTWQELLGYDDNLMQLQYQKAYDFYQNADYHNASAAFSFLTMINPYQYDYWMGLGSSKQSERHFEEAIVSFTAAEAMNPEEPAPHLQLAQCFYALNVLEETTNQLKLAIKIAGERPEFQEIRKMAISILTQLPR